MVVFRPHKRSHVIYDFYESLRAAVYTFFQCACTENSLSLKSFKSSREKTGQMFVLASVRFAVHVSVRTVSSKDFYVGWC